jgi:hypothetical protein
MRSAARLLGKVLMVALVAAPWLDRGLWAQDARRRTTPPQGYRRLVPGIETTIPIQWDPAETVSHQNLVEILVVPNIDWTPQTVSKSETLKDKATRAAFRRDVWNLEFSFLPMRMIQVDIPSEGGKLRRAMVWYMVYRVNNKGGHLHAERQENGTWEIKKIDHPVTFVPTFTLYSPEMRKSYLDTVIPVALDPIRRREDPRRRLLNSAQLVERPIEVSTQTRDNSVWGVATWESGYESGGQVDPRTDFFSIFITGLSNAYRFADRRDAGAYKAGDPPGKGRLYRQKTLQLNFWRPSDEFSEEETDIYLGAPRDLGIEGQIDYQWVFR